MGKSTVAAAVLRELHDQNVSAAFVPFETPGQLKREVATALQTCLMISMGPCCN